MKYIIAIKITETNEVNLFEFANEFEREDFAYDIMKEYVGLEIGYTQDDWIVDGEQILYCYECLNGEV